MPAKKNVSYITQEKVDYHQVKHLLDVYIPSTTDADALFPVLIFIHGGTWISGNKEMYAILGAHFAEKGVLTVIINYRLGDIVTVDRMAEDCAAATEWVYRNIEKYRGDKNRIYLSGHSAGGHLASLVALDRAYHPTVPEEAIKGCILIDAFGLNISRFIREHGTFYIQYIEKIFTGHEKTWDKLSPVNFLRPGVCPFQVFTGGSSYPFLIQDNRLFIDQLKAHQIPHTHRLLPGKSHTQMITQMENKDNALYQTIIDFMASVKV